MITRITQANRKQLKNTDIVDLGQLEYFLSEWLEATGESIAIQEIEQVKSGYLREEKRRSVGHIHKNPQCIKLFAKEVPHRFNQYTMYSLLNQHCFSALRTKWQSVLKSGVMDIKEQGGWVIPKNPVILYRFRFKRYTKYPATPNSLFILQALQDWGIIDAGQSKEAISVIQSIYAPYNPGTEITVLALEELVKHPELLVKTYNGEDYPI